MITSIKTSHKLEENQATYIYLTRASLVAHLVKMQETPVQCLGWEDPLEKGQATHSSILGLSWWPDSKESACNAETWVQSLGWKDPLKEGMATYSGVFPWRRGAWWASLQGWTRLRNLAHAYISDKGIVSGMQKNINNSREGIQFNFLKKEITIF